MSHNIQYWSEENSTITAVPRPWSGIVVNRYDPSRRALVKCNAATRDEALALLSGQVAPGYILIAAFFGDVFETILRTE